MKERIRFQFIIHHSAFIISSATLFDKEKPATRSKAAVADEKPKVSNEISDGTGQFDARFVLWRRFCAENNVAVETLPSQLTGEAKDIWDKLKNEQLHKSTKSDK
jgi:hypothetical protein